MSNFFEQINNTKVIYLNPGFYHLKSLKLSKKFINTINSFDMVKVNRFSTLLLLLLHLTLCIYCQDFPFEKKIWTYWHDDDFSKAPMLARQCSEHIRQVAEKAGFQYYRLSKSTVKQYIRNFDERITKVRQKSKQGGLSQEADLIRVNLLADNGGIWMDMTVYLYEGLDWIVNIKSQKYRNILTNRFSKQLDILLPYFNGFQNTEQYRIKDPNDKNKLILYNEMPGYEVWFMASKKNGKLIEEIRQTYTRFTQLQFHQMVEIYHNEEIYMNTVDFGSYLTIDMAICYVIQKRQFELDQQNGLFQTRKTASEYYNLWSFSGVLGPLFWTYKQDWAVNHMIELSREEYEKQGYMMNLFLKNLGWFSSRLEQHMHRSKQLFYDQNLTFQQFLQSKPNQYQCHQTTFLAEDSLLYLILKNSTERTTGHIKIITKQEKKRWNQYCKKYEGQWKMDEMVASMFFAHIKSIDGVAYRAHEIVNFDRSQTQTLKQNIDDFLFERKANIEFFCKFLAHFSVFNIIEIMCLVGLQWIWTKLRNSNQEKAHELSLKQKLLGFGDYGIIIFIGTLSFYKYFMIDFFAFRDDPLGTALVLAIVYYLQSKIQKSAKTNPTLKTLYDLSYLYITYCTTYMTFCLTRRYKVILFECVFVIGLLGPCLFRLYDRLSVYKQLNNPVLRSLRGLSSQSAYQIGSVSLLLVLYLFPTLRYYVIDGHYIISFIPIILSLIVVVCYIILLYECIKTRVMTQILNLLILGTLTWQLYSLFLKRNTNVDQNQRRIGWNLIAVSLFSIIYLQIGSSYAILARKLASGEKSQQKWLKRTLISILETMLFFGGFGLQIMKGYFLHMTWIPYNLKEWFYEMFFIIFYCFFIAVYINFRDQASQQQNQNQSQPISEMEDLTLVGTEMESK